MIRKHLITVVLACFVFFIVPCQAQPLHQQNVPAVPVNALLADGMISDIPVTSKADTISYALGVVWANGIAKVGRNTISAAFYSGALAYMDGDKSVMDVYRAEKLLDSGFEKIKYDTAWPSIDGNMKVSAISLASKYDTMSYALGMAWCRGVKQQGIWAVTPALLVGLSKSLKGENVFFDYAAADQYLWRHIEALRTEKFASTKNTNEQWLAANRTKKDVVALPSGLQYKVLKRGNGKTPKAEDRVACMYVARLIDGIAFESSFADHDGKPLKLFLSGGIKGWQEVLLLMKEGDVWELYVPWHLAYGSGGMKDYVPPFATVIYELELVKVDDSPF